MELDEEEFNKKLLEIEYIRRELENYISALNTLQVTQESLARAVQGLDRIGEGDALIPYTPDIFFKGSIKDTSSAYVNIGSNVFKSLKLNDLKKKLEKDLGELGKNLEEIANVIVSLQEQGSKLEEETNRLYEEYRKNIA